MNSSQCTVNVRLTPTSLRQLYNHLSLRVMSANVLQLRMFPTHNQRALLSFQYDFNGFNFILTRQNVIKETEEGDFLTATWFLKFNWLNEKVL